MKKVVIYTWPICNFCSAAKHLLSKKKVNYEEIDIGDNPENRDEMLSCFFESKIKLCEFSRYSISLE